MGHDFRMATINRSATITRTSSVRPGRISDLPKRYQAVARSFQPAIAKVSSKYSALEVVQILSAAMAEEFFSRPQPKIELAMAFMKGAMVREEMKAAEGGSLSAEEAGAKLGISKPAALKRYQKGQLLGWREARQNAVRFPVWQFGADDVLPGLPAVLNVFREAPWIDDWGRIAFFLTPLDSMGKRRPLDLLRDGDMQPVVWGAQALAE